MTVKNIKAYYTVKEACQIKCVSEEKLFELIRNKTIPTEQVGTLLMIPAVGVFEYLAKEETAIRIESYFKQLRPKLIKMLEAAPRYGSCGINITFHDGKIYKVSMVEENTILEEKL